MRAQRLLVRALLCGKRAPPTRRSVCEPSAVRIGKWQCELHVLPAHRELNRRVRVGLDEEDLVRAVITEHTLELEAGAMDLHASPRPVASRAVVLVLRCVSPHESPV